MKEPHFREHLPELQHLAKINFQLREYVKVLLRSREYLVQQGDRQEKLRLGTSCTDPSSQNMQYYLAALNMHLKILSESCKKLNIQSKTCT